MISTDFEKLLQTNELLIEMNEKLVTANLKATELAKICLDNNHQLFAICSKIYKYLDSKINKTWEEQESLDILHNLIFHTEKLNHQ